MALALVASLHARAAIGSALFALAVAEDAEDAEGLRREGLALALVPQIGADLREVGLEPRDRGGIHLVAHAPRPHSRKRRAKFASVVVGASEEGQLHARLARRELGRFVRAVFCYALVEEAAAASPAAHALLDPRGDVCDVGSRGRGAFAKHGGTGGARAGEDAIPHQDVR